MSALSTLASALKAMERDGRADPEDAVLLLAESWVSASRILARHLRVRVRTLSAEQAEDVVATVAADLARVYGRWREEAPFQAFIERALMQCAYAVLRRQLPEVALDPELLSVSSEDAAPEPADDTTVRVRALRRLVWYLYGSPDNPRRLNYDKAPADFLALAARLEGRPYSELVRNNQPRPGDWGEGQGEADRKWWRGRATVAQARLQRALASPATRDLLEAMTAQLALETA